MITLPCSEVPENHLQVRKETPPSQYGWSIIWELSRVGESADPKPWEGWKDKQSSSHCYLEQRCHKSFEAFDMEFPGSRKLIIHKQRTETGTGLPEPRELLTPSNSEH